METSLPFKYSLAPMAEISTPALRQTIKDFSENILLFSEMLSAGAIAAGSHHNEPLVKKHEFDDPFVYQVVGSSPDAMSEACSILSGYGCYSVDINMGCPSPDITKKGAGAKLLDDADNAKKIIEACRKKCSTKLSVKMRTGYDSNDREKLINFVKMLEGEGIDFLTIHPRYSKLYFTRKADWELIDLVCSTVKIPVIGNGDITSPDIAISRLKGHSCTAIMIGREAVKSPWIFKLCENMGRGSREKLEINIHEIFIKTLERTKKHLPENLHKSRGHRFCFYFSKNLKFSHEIFKKIRQVEKIDDMKELVDNYYDRNPEEKIKKF